MRYGLGRSGIVLALLFVVCAVASAANKNVAAGTWGGQHAVLTVTKDGGAIEFDCANARIEKPLVADSSGRFVADGIMGAEHAGPVRDDDAAKGTPVKFRGHIDGDTMTLTMEINAQEDQSFTLKFNDSGRLMKCR